MSGPSERSRDGERRGTVPPGPDDLTDVEVETELQELIGELRVATTGVQVLFAFLLTVAFSARFETVSDFERNVYFVSLLLSALSSAFLIAPTAYHRVNFGQHDKRHLLRICNRLALAGLAVLVLAVSSVLMLITDVVYSPLAGAIVAAVAAVFLSGLWLALPIGRRRALGPRNDERG
ncbi:MAG: DUF6328 family protein [Solirubrobacterales bacterium]